MLETYKKFILPDIGLLNSILVNWLIALDFCTVNSIFPLMFALLYSFFVHVNLLAPGWHPLCLPQNAMKWHFEGS